VRFPGPLASLVPAAPLSAAAWAGRAAIRAGDAGVAGIRSAAPGAPVRGVTAALSLPVRPVRMLTSAAALPARPARLLASAAAAAISDLGPSRNRRHMWSQDGRAHIEVRGLTGPGRAHRRLAADVTSALTQLKGVSWAEVNAVTAHVLVIFDEDETGPGELVEAVEAVEAAHGTDADDFPWTRPPHPADEAPAGGAATALAADCLGIVFALTGRLARLGTPPRAFRAPIALIDAQPRLRLALARPLGPVGSDLVMAVGNVIAHGLTGGEGPLAVDAAHRVLQLGELQARRAVWERREREVHSAGHGLPAEAPEHVPRPSPIPRGPVEQTADRTSIASLLGAAGILAWTRDPGRAADAILATVPKAARLGREGFAARLGRDLAVRGVIALDSNALRRLDRVSAVVIDAAVLCSDRPQVLSAESTSRRLSEAEVWQFAERVLHGRPAAELQGRGPWARGGWRLRRPPEEAGRERAGPEQAGPEQAGPEQAGAAAMGPAALTLDLADAHGRRRGSVTVGLELDPLADPVLGAAREAAGQVLLTEHESVTDVVSWADEVLPSSVRLAEHVRRLQAAGHGVLTVSADDDEALAASDVAIDVLPGSRGVCWSADLVCGPGLVEVWRILRAAATARQVSQRSARLSTGGSAVGALLITARAGPRRRRGGLTPVHSAALAALVSGAASARSLARRPEPVPMPRGTWHAMTAEDAFARLREARQPPPAHDAGPEATGPAPGADGTAPAVAVPAVAVPAVAVPAVAVPAVTGQAVTGQAVTGPAVAVPAVRAPARATLEFARMVGEELRDPLTPVLALGAVASAVVGSGVDAALVGAVVAGNALISGGERMRAEHALRRLLLGEEVAARRVMLPAPGGGPAPARGPFTGIAQAPTETVRARDLAVGDIIRLRPSDVVPADARLLVADDLEVDDSSLTGESVPVTKTPGPTPGAALADRTCMIYEGTSILAGTADAIVTASGGATEAGRAASSAERAAPPVGLQGRLAELTRIALPATGLGGLAVTGIGLMRGVPLRQAMASGVAVAVAAVPEGLPLVATVSELAAARRLSARGVLVRSARALEALGRVDTVCFDKTGTLTEGRVAVAALALPGPEPGADIPFDSPPGRRLLRVAARACPQADGGAAGRLAHATDRAVVEAAHAHAGADRSWRLVDELPFETSRGYAASFGELSGRARIAVKGAPEVVLTRCAAVAATAPSRGVPATRRGGPATGDGAPAVALTPARRRQVHALVQDLAARGLRVLAVAEAEQPDLAEQYRRAGGQVADLVSGLTLAGFVAFADPARPSAEEAVRKLKESGARIVMITGDHPTTAEAIAREIGIPEADRVVSGRELDKLSEAASAARINAGTVFARVSPELKVHIVRSLQRSGHVVAMTGDGTNDAAAIRVADVGIGVWARGSTSARSSADLVLTDSDPARIADALGEGRALWASARDAVSILVGGNAGEVAFMLLGTAFSGRAPLNTRQLLLVNLLTDMLPALAVAVAPATPASNGDSPLAEGGPMRSFMGAGLLRDVGIRGGATALGALGAWQAGRMTGRRRRADTMGLAAVVLTELGQTLITNWRSPLVVATSAISAAILAGIVETPAISQFFGCTPLGPVAWAIATGSAAGATVVAAFAPAVVARLVPGDAIVS
jgi:cation-transporting P-type ATPase I